MFGDAHNYESLLNECSGASDHYCVADDLLSYLGAQNKSVPTLTFAVYTDRCLQDRRGLLEQADLATEVHLEHCAHGQVFQ